MHAYAAEDPVFLAMNRRGQEETAGRLGTFCVNCHAPLAVRDGLIDDGLGVEDLPENTAGVTCYFCHSVDSVDGEHNNPLELADDRIMRGPLADPAPTSAHGSRYSSLLDGRHQDSAKMCGACHDVRLTEEIGAVPFDLERTYAEWKTSLFNRPTSEGGVTCNGCHMPVSAERTTTAETRRAPKRLSRRHDFEGVDLALTPFFGRDRQRLLVEQFLASSLLAELCVSETGRVQMTLENVGSGHSWPSGATHDREPWVELRAYREGSSEPLFETVAPELAGEGAESIVLNDTVLDQDGEPAHMFWEAAQLGKSSTIAGVATRDPLSPDFHRERRIWEFDADPQRTFDISRVTLLVRVRPIGLAILADLVASGHLESEVLSAMPVIDVLPERCVDDSLRERFPALAVGSERCDDADPDRAFTLVWTRAEAERTSTRSRRTSLDGAPAACVAHPTYVAVPTVRD
jgi:hypothetical protein